MEDKDRFEQDDGGAVDDAVHEEATEASSDDGEVVAGMNEAQPVVQQIIDSATSSTAVPESNGKAALNGSKVQNVALVVAMTGFDPAVVVIMQRAAKMDYEGSPAERRKSIYGDLERLRSQSTLLRTQAAEKMFGDVPALDQAKVLVEQANEVDAAAAKLAKAYEDLLNRAQRRARRDGALKGMERDPQTGERWSNGPFYYDPKRPEMAELYGHLTTPAAVYADESKLVRADSGRYGRTGGHILVVREAERATGEKVSERFLRELVMRMDWDLMERVHGMGSGLCRTASWVIRLWSEATKTPLDYSTLPRRHPLPVYDEWAEEFDAEYVKALERVRGVSGSGEAHAADMQEVQ